VKQRAVQPRPRNVAIEICVLAAGLSTRMKRDKTKLRFGSRTMLGHIRAIAAETHLPVRVIRRDLVARCGPLGGVLTALRTTRADAVLFLACDMPLVSVALIERVVRKSRGGIRAVFAVQGDVAGFPFLLSSTTMALVEKQIAVREFSLNALARVSKAALLRVARGSRELRNINTPDDYADALRHWRFARKTGGTK